METRWNPAPHLVAPALRKVLSTRWQRQGIEAKQASRCKGRRVDPKRRAQVVALRESCHSISKTAELAGCSPAQMKRIWAEVSQAEAKQCGAFVEDALTEADALAAVGQDERQEERA